MNRVWPIRLKTPPVELGSPTSRAIAVLEATGGKVFEEMDGEARTLRVNLPEYKMAIYDTEGVVSSVWYNDPAGRLTSFGKQRKIRLYTERFTSSGSWELRISNDWMLHLFNDVDRLHLVYGIHMDVIRINSMVIVDRAQQAS